MLYYIQYSHATADQKPMTESGGKLIIDGLDKPEKDVIQDVWRWCDERERNLPSVFKRIYCIKISCFHPPTITKSGALNGGGGSLPFYEWKCDWPMAKQQREMDSHGK